MYKVIFKPTYEEPTDLGRANDYNEAMRLVYDFCGDHRFTPAMITTEKKDDIVTVDIHTGTDYFDIIEEKTYCSAADCINIECTFHPTKSSNKDLRSDLTNFCGNYDSEKRKVYVLVEYYDGEMWKRHQSNNFKEVFDFMKAELLCEVINRGQGEIWTEDVLDVVSLAPESDYIERDTDTFTLGIGHTQAWIINKNEDEEIVWQIFTVEV